MATFHHSQTPFPWAMGILGKDIPARPSHGNRSHSGSTSSAGSERIRIIDLTQHEALMKKEMAYQEFYLSSEEDLSPLDEDLEDSESFKSFGFSTVDEDEGEDDDSLDLDYDLEDALNAYASDIESPWKEERPARVISITFSGKPNMVDVLPTPVASPIRSQPETRETSFDQPNYNMPTPRPNLLHNRVARLSGSAFVEATMTDSDKRSINSETQRSERRHSSIYSTTNPPSPNIFNPLRRKSVADQGYSMSELPVLGAPAVPSVPTTINQAPVRHSRMKSLSRMGFFKSSKKDRKDGPPPISASQQITTSAPRTPAAVPPSPQDFAPAPFIRPLGKLVARAANERDHSPVWQEIMNGPMSRPSRLYDNYGDDELSDDDSSMGMRGRDPDFSAKVRKRRSMLGLAY